MKLVAFYVLFGLGFWLLVSSAGWDAAFGVGLVALAGDVLNEM